MENKKTPAECCPPFDPTLWDSKTFEWKDKRFMKGKVFTLFYMPVNYGSVVGKLMKRAENSGAVVQDWLMLSDHNSRWNMDLYAAVDREVPGAEMATLSGKYISKVFEGPFIDMSQWQEEFDIEARSRNLKIEKQYWWYTTCPKCAKKHGKNYVVLIAKLGE